MARVFDHVLIIMFENEYRSYVMANPYMRWLAGQGIDMANYHGAMHPSQTNYIASAAGQLCGVTSDDDPRAAGSGAVLDAKCIVDLMQPAEGAAPISWKAYMENYVGELTWVAQPPYYTKHNPFYMFDSVQSDPARVARIVDAKQLLRDIAAGEMPNYAWLTPNIWNDGHYLRGTKFAPNIRYLLVNQIADWLEHELFGPAGLNFPGPESKLPANTLVVVTFDEADYESVPGGSSYEGPNQIYTVLLGDLDAIVPGTVIREGYNHYSLLRTIEDNFGLGTLGTNDAASGPMRFLRGEHFSWSNPANLAPPHVGDDGTYVPLATTTGIVLGTYSDRAYMVSQGDGTDAAAYWNSFDGARWTDQQALTSVGTISGPMAMAGTRSALTLVYFDAGGVLSFVTYTDASGWGTPAAVPGANASVAPVALASFADEQELLLVFHTAAGLASMTYADGAWSRPTAIVAANVSQVMPGSSLALAELGNLLLLVYVD
ncbi:MAG: phosphoesterase, partial [Myxococcales bacterium]|nr:phosphoesterase [Myxococcales bacterium]